jgi:hypothetical protein
MSRVISLVCIFATAFLAACSEAVPAQLRQTAGSATFVPPPGWDRAVSPIGVTYFPPNDADAAAIQILPGEELRGDFAAWFDDRWVEFLAQYAHSNRGNPFDGQSTQGLRARIAMASLDTPAGGTVPIRFFAVVDGARAQPILMMYRDENAVARYSEVALAAFETVRILPRDEQPPPQVVNFADFVPAQLVAPRRQNAGGAGGGPRDGLQQLKELGIDLSETRQEQVARLRSPNRLLGSSWVVATYLSNVQPTMSARSIQKELHLSTDGQYEHKAAGDRSAETGAYELRGDQLILKPSWGRARTYAWYFGGDPEMRANPRVYGECPTAPDCFSLLYLRDASGREEIWREDPR